MKLLVVALLGATASAQHGGAAAEYKKMKTIRGQGASRFLQDKNQGQLIVSCKFDGIAALPFFHAPLHLCLIY